MGDPFRAEKDKPFKLPPPPQPHSSHASSHAHSAPAAGSDPFLLDPFDSPNKSSKDALNDPHNVALAGGATDSAAAAELRRKERAEQELMAGILKLG
jgi:hypothetical protein